MLGITSNTFKKYCGAVYAMISKERILSVLISLILAFTVYNLFVFFRWNMFENLPLSTVTTFFTATTIVSVLSAFIIRYEDIPDSVSALLRVAVPVFMLMWIVGYIPITPSDVNSDLLINSFRLVAVVAAFLGFFRPTLFLPILVYTGLAKTYATHFYDVPISFTDYRPVLGPLLLLMVGILCYGFARYVYLRLKLLYSNTALKTYFETPKQSYYHPLNLLLYIALSIYLASYYFSGVQKIILDNAGLYWSNQNTTYTLVLAAQLYKLFPVTSLLKLAPWLYSIIYALTPLLNWYTLIAELLALLCFQEF